MRKVYLLLLLSFTSVCVQAQTTVFSDNFNTSQGNAYTIATGPIGISPDWSLLNLADFGAKIDNNILDLTNDGSGGGNGLGFAYAHAQTSAFAAPFNTTLNLNPGLVTWTFNMRQIQANPGGFTIGNFGVGFILGATGGLNGYGVLLGQAGTTDPVRLVSFTGTVGSFTDLIISNTVGLNDFGNEYLSIKVTYDPVTNTWELFVRNDGLTAFADPAVGVLTYQGTVVDATYTNVATVNMGGFWQGSITPNQTAFFDNVTVTVNSVATHTITTGTVSLPPFLLANCGATATGSVDFTSTGTFNAPNIYTAQLSDDIGSFATPVTVGTLASTTNAGTINIVIPAGTPSGVGYKIRVDSNDPAVLGFESAAFSIIQSGTGGCASSHTDYYRSILTGDWADPSIWQSSPDNINWISATLSPTFLAKTINVRNSNTVTLTSTVIADEVVVDFNAILINNMAPVNALIINNGPGVDLDIQTGGVYQVVSGNGYFLYQVVNGGATVHIANQGSILIGSGGPLAGSNQNGFAITSGTYIWDNGSIFDWNTTSIPGTSGLTFFPDAAATVSPVLRFTAAPATAIGGANPFVVNGILEPNTAVIFDGASNKTFRNGIHGTANVTMNAGAGQLIVDGQVASFRGAGTIIPNSLGLLIGRNAAAILAVLTTNKTVNGNIVFHPTATSAIINVGPHFLTVSGIVTNGSTTKYVQTNINGGALTLNNITTSKTFPIGETTYNPLIITTASGDNFTARVRTGIFDPSGAIPTDAVNRTWYINSSNAGNTPGVHVTYQYSDNPGELTGSAATQPTSMEVLQSDFTTWHLSPGNNAILSVGSNPYTVTTMAPLTINSTPIPYALGVTGTQFLALDFFITARAQKRNNNADINWNVMETANLLGFDVQRSANNGAYQTIGTVNPTAQLLHYTFTDTRVEAGVNLYRIRVNRAAGGLRYSNTVAIINGSKGLLITGLAPNPMHGHGLLTLSAAKQGMVNFELYNMNGALARQWRSPVNEGTNTLTFATGGLPGGIYQLIASADGVRTVFRIVIQ